MTDLSELEALLGRAADAWRDFMAKREAMNAARPDVMTATPAERALYDERYRADHEAEREHFRTVIELAQHAESLLSTIRSLEAALVEAREALRGLVKAETIPVHTDYDHSGTYIWSDCIRTDTHEFTRAASALSKLEGGE